VKGFLATGSTITNGLAQEKTALLT
jgi:hypothetical protein